MIRAALLSAFATAVLATAPAHAQYSTPIPDETPATEYIYAEAPTDHVIGSVDAPHTMILYASNVCPACGHWFANHWPIVKTELVETGRLRLVFRPMPTEPVQLSLTGFLMAECAPKGEYITVIEDQFARQTTILGMVQNRISPKPEYDAIAMGAGLQSDEAIQACLSDPDMMAAVRQKADWASAADIHAVPSFIFDGEVMDGDHNADAIRSWMDRR
ncbi:thioredoxin domain-containing protein [Algimonas porphyrae]|uniref:Thioredoxin-like fold domain-containing protein n=1 Tax=Algimonas porphyrae TaxID=1128113 RepID=A0ABQ5UW68_9PROT|nr:thioredoxin domain-containing protein [Algimonas porphyrae]GLQ19332.1 hypothetical protein GCM10007854_02870 [Algimonas porphyrae]